MDIFGRINEIKGIGDKTALLFNKIGVFTVYDLLRYIPVSYEEFPEITPICELKEGIKNAVYGMIMGNISERRAGKLSIISFVIGDATGKCKVTVFNMPYLKKTLKNGARYVYYGKCTGERGLIIEQPSFYKIDEYEEKRKILNPKYPLIKGLTNKTITSALIRVFQNNPEIIDNIPEDIIKRYKILNLSDALKCVHFPKNVSEYENARKSLAFREFLSFLLETRLGRSSQERAESPYPFIEVADTKRLIEALPYRLTSAQLKVFNDIEKDMASGYSMNRLLQGDVGSGKTIVAVLSLLMCVANCFQGAFMAPTEVLARQHYAGINSLTKEYHLPFKPVLLTGSLSAKEKKEVQKKIELGEYNLIIGTSALISEKAVYKNLALVVTDEQHRFGVRQRETLAAKGLMPHILVMSATPIPRTLAIILFGEQSVSVIDEYPSDRKKIKTCMLDESKRGSALSFILKEVQKGHQAYIVCPMVDENDENDLQDVITYTEKLENSLPEGIKTAFLHGKMKNEEKNRIMDSFLDKNIDILVSTTVIEVGVDVPNATVMMVENSERFGLATLHQLRGRVGRGDAESFCIYILGTDSAKSKERVEVLVKSTDGFYIASQDLKTRGPGDLFGIRQSGVLDFKIGDIYKDSEILSQASECADSMILENRKEEALQIIEDEGLEVDFRSI